MKKPRMAGPTINKKLLPVKVHNFFKYGAGAVISFLPVIARQKGVPAEAIGLMWTILPLVNIFAYLFLSQMADRYNSHKTFFIIGLCITFIGKLSFCVTPSIPLPNRTNNTLYTSDTYENLRYTCQDDIKLITLCHIPSDTNDLSCDNNDIDVNIRKKCILTCLSDNDIEFVSNYSTNSVCIKNECVISELDDSISEGINVSCNSLKSIECNLKCESFARDEVYSESLSASGCVASFEFWLLVLSLVLLYGGNSISTTMCDTATFQLLGEQRYKYGIQRLWGSLGWGLMGLALGGVVDYFSRGLPERDYTSAFIIALVGMFFAVVSGVFIQFKITKKLKNEKGRVCGVLGTFKVFLFMLCIIVVGTSQGVLWTFLFMLMEDVVEVYDPNFTNLNLLQGLVLGICCFLGEVPAMFLSGHVIKKLGNIRTFTLALTTYSVRFLLHSFVTNPWWFLPIEFLHSMSFGIFYPNMSSYASKIAPPGRSATMQGIVKAAFGAGYSTGSLAGGVLFKNYGGSQMFFCVGLLDTVFTIFFVTCQMIYARNVKNKMKKNEEMVGSMTPASLLNNEDMDSEDNMTSQTNEWRPENDSSSSESISDIEVFPKT